MAETTATGRLEANLKIIGVVVTLGGFLWGMWTYSDTKRRELAREDRAAAQLAETRRIEATKPFLERQLKLYTEASQVAAMLATTQDETEKLKARRRFSALYWGELVLVESKEVEDAMEKFGDCLRANCDQRELQRRSLSLANTCRDSLAVSWGVKEWETQAFLRSALKKP
jgi:ribulose bisphosphate carboxylase small subunit